MKGEMVGSILAQDLCPVLEKKGELQFGCCWLLVGVAGSFSVMTWKLHENQVTRLTIQYKMPQDTDLCEFYQNLLGAQESFM